MIARQLPHHFPGLIRGLADGAVCVALFSKIRWAVRKRRSDALQVRFRNSNGNVFHALNLQHGNEATPHSIGLDRAFWSALLRRRIGNNAIEHNNARLAIRDEPSYRRLKIIEIDPKVVFNGLSFL
jgi:hypothetical protein